MEQAIQDAVMSGIKEIAKDSVALEHIITFGKVSDAKIVSFNAEVVSVVKTLYPILEVAKVLIPANTPIAGDVMNWIEKIYPVITGQDL